MEFQYWFSIKFKSVVVYLMLTPGEKRHHFLNLNKKKTKIRQP